MKSTKNKISTFSYQISIKGKEFVVSLRIFHIAMYNLLIHWKTKLKCNGSQRGRGRKRRKKRIFVLEVYELHKTCQNIVLGTIQ